MCSVLDLELENPRFHLHSKEIGNRIVGLSRWKKGGIFPVYSSHLKCSKFIYKLRQPSSHSYLGGVHRQELVGWVGVGVLISLLRMGNWRGTNEGLRHFADSCICKMIIASDFVPLPEK